MSENLLGHSDDSPFGWARIENTRSGCFSSGGTTLEISFDDTETASVKIISDNSKNDFNVEKTRVEDFLTRIIFLGRKREVFSESGWTIVRYASVEWRNLSFCEETAGKISAFSNEWTIGEMEEFLPKIKDAENARKVKETLAKGLHRRAIEIHLETEKFVGELLPPKQKDENLL